LSQFPPPDYILTESNIEGIEIYKPASIDDNLHQEVVDFKCPQCGAVTAYSVADGGLKCTHCGFYEVDQKEIVGKGAQQYEFTLETMERAAHGWGEARRELECQNCGARITMSVKDLTASCPFCASNKVVHQEAPQDILRPRFLIPFRVEAHECQKIVREWLGNTWMVPKELRKLANIADFVPIYLPFWTFDAVGSADWQAEVGHTETERYYDHSDRTWKTRTKTVWRWESGQVEVPFDDVLILGTRYVSRLLLGRIYRFNLDELVPYGPSFLAGFQAQAYDIPLEKAWEDSRSVMRESTRIACLGQASSTKIRNFSMNLDFSDESWRYILLPVYVASYSYDGQVFQALVNGQNGSISGQRPVDWNKVWLVIALLLSPGILFGIIGLVTLLFAGVGVLIGGFGLVLLIIGIVISVIVFQKAQGLDDV
jgi:Zn finger protein HypA/HybF involved in hydrogenase expression